MNFKIVLTSADKFTKDRFLGQPLGLAIGDALGAPGEFLSLDEILAKYGSRGIEEFYPWHNFDAGSYTDDTQLSLATMYGIMGGHEFFKDNGYDGYKLFVFTQFEEWAESQQNLFYRRAPGKTCLETIESEHIGSLDYKVNNSKGCGGVMRSAPVGMAFPPGEAFKRGAEFAAITHSHPSGYLPAGFLAEMIAHIIRNKSIYEAINKSAEILLTYENNQETYDSLSLAIELSQKYPKISAQLAIEKIGLGWTGEEALAISVYCVLVNPNNWLASVIMAINHSGDSDSTGSICGAIQGTRLGIDSIPQNLIERVEDSNVLLDLANQYYKLFGTLHVNQ